MREWQRGEEQKIRGDGRRGMHRKTSPLTRASGWNFVSGAGEGGDFILSLPGEAH